MLRLSRSDRRASHTGDVAWLIDPVCRRLHRTTPWRVLRATDGDRLAPGHVLVAAVRDRLRPVLDRDRYRLQADASWRDVTGAARVLIGVGVDGLRPESP